jgi:hypothetical protein
MSDWNQSSLRDSAHIISVTDQKELDEVRPTSFDDVLTQRTKTKAVRR